MSVLNFSSVDFQKNTEKILIAAGKPEFSKIKVLQGGYVNNCYLLELSDNSKLVMKVWTNNNQAVIKQLISNTLYLEEQGLFTPLHLLLKNDERILILDDKPWILMPYFEGDFLSANSSSLYVLGIIQAKLHQIPVKEGIPQSYSYGFDFWDELIENSQTNRKVTPFTKMLEKESEILKNKIPDNLPKGIIHGDLKLENIIVNKQRILAVLDLEDMCFDWLLLDIAMTYAHCGWKNGHPVKKLWESLLDGYQSVRPLEDCEKEAISYLHKYSVLALAAWRYRQYVVKKIQKNLKKRYLEMADRLKKNFYF